MTESCISPSLVPSPNGEGVILLGCENNPRDMFELKNKNGVLAWMKMTQKLEYPRSHTNAMLIPDTLVNCY